MSETMPELVQLKYTQAELDKLVDIWGSMPTTDDLRQALMWQVISCQEWNKGHKWLAKNQTTDTTIHLKKTGYKPLFDEVLRDVQPDAKVEGSLVEALRNAFLNKAKKERNMKLSMPATSYQRLLDTIGDLRGQVLHGFDPHVEKLAKKYIEISLHSYRQTLELEKSGFSILLDSGAGKIETVALNKSRDNPAPQ